MAGTPGGHDILFARDFPPMDGGISRWMAAIADRYPPDGLIVSTGGGPLSDASISQRVDRIATPVDRLRTLPGHLAWSRRAIRLASGPAARFAWCDTIRPAGYTAHRAYRSTGLPYGIMVVGNDILTLRAKLGRGGLGQRIKRRIMRAVLGDAAVLVAISEWTAARLRELLIELDLGAAGARVRVVPLGTDPVRWHADPEAAAAFRRRRSLPAGRWLVTVARLVDYKGIDTAILLLAALAPEFPELQYAVIGSGPDEARLLALAASAGVADRIHIMTDVTDAELPAAYSMGEVYLGFTRETALDVEGFGISFAEAAACGVPVIATRSGGIPDAVVDGETGLLLAEGDLAGMTAALHRLLTDPLEARRMGTAGRARVERYLNWDRVVREMREMAAELGRPAPPSS